MENISWFSNTRSISRISLLLITLLILSCRNNKDSSNITAENQAIEVIDLSEIKPVVEEIRLSDFAGNIKYTPLEYSQESILAARNSSVQSDGKYFFIADQGSIKQFDNNGAFIRSLFKVGRGPDELLCNDFTIDEDSSDIYINSNYKHFLFRYKYDSPSKKKLTKTTFEESSENVDNIFVWNRKLFISFYHDGIFPFYLKVYDLDKNELVFCKKNKIAYTKPESHGSLSLTQNEFQIQEFGEYLLFKDLTSDTIFQTKDLNVIEPRYVLNFGNNKLNYIEYLNYTNAALPMKKGTIVLMNFLETKNDILFLLGETMGKTTEDPLGINISRLFAVYNKTSKQVKFTYNRIIKNDIDNGPDINFKSLEKIDSQNDAFFFYIMIQPTELLKLTDTKETSDTLRNDDLVRIINNLKETDNPVMMRIELKGSNHSVAQSLFELHRV